MFRKPVLQDAFLFALLEAGDDGLNVTKWYTINKPKEFQESYPDFMKTIDELSTNKLIDHTDFLDTWKLTKIGKERTNSIEGEIDKGDYISLMKRVSPKEELRKRTQNIETFIVSIFFTLLSFIELSTKNITNFPSIIISGFFIFYLIIFVIGLRYSISSFFQIVQFWAYYSIIHGKTANQMIIISINFYKGHEKVINFIYKYILIPLILLLITVYSLGWTIQNAIGTLIIAIFAPSIISKSK